MIMASNDDNDGHDDTEDLSSTLIILLNEEFYSIYLNYSLQHAQGVCHPHF